MWSIIKNSIILSILLIWNFQASAQEKWNLNKCVQYAVSKNIDLNLTRNILQKQKIDFSQSKAALLPSLNTGGGLTYNFGRNIDGNTNTITYNETLSNTYWLNASVDLFQGLTKIHRIQFNKNKVLAAQQEVEKVKNQLIFDIITHYYVALYSLALETAAKNQVKLSELQYKRMQKLVSVGKESPMTVQDLESQWMQDRLQLQTAINQTEQQIAKLKALLRLPTDENVVLDTIGIPQIMPKMPALKDIYQNALQILPQIKQQQFLLKAKQKQLAIAKGKILPNLYLSAGVNTYFFDGNPMPFRNQIDNNQNQFISFGLRIPIFNGSEVHSQIKRSKIALNDQKLLIEKQREALYADILEVYNNVRAAESEYQSSVALFKFNRLALKNVQKKLEKGLASTTDFEVVKQRLFKAQTAMFKAKLSYVMYAQILQFYQTGNWNHLKK